MQKHVYYIKDQDGRRGFIEALGDHAYWLDNVAICWDGKNWWTLVKEVERIGEDEEEE